MEGQFLATREDLYHVQMDMKHVQAVQTSHGDRLLRLERRQADDAALKSVWSSPFPSILGGTPQPGPLLPPPADVFDDIDDEHSQNLLGSLHIDSEEEPIRRGASRANSVRFDVSALQGAGWTQPSRLSNESGSVRPSSVLGSHPLVERSLSHKSDGRHSSAGHSVHSVHSAPSGRSSSLRLDTNFLVGTGQDDESPEAAGPPAGLFYMGTVPAIIRCWLNEDFSHRALIYAAVCTGSHKSIIDFEVVKKLSLTQLVQKDELGNPCITLPVYLPEAIVTRQPSRPSTPTSNVPTLTTTFHVTGMHARSRSTSTGAIQVFLGSDVLRAHNADVLFSQNILSLYCDDRAKVSVPFIRPEDENMFKTLCVTHAVQDRTELQPTAAPFTPKNKSVEVEAHATNGMDVPEAHHSPTEQTVAAENNGPALNNFTNLSRRESLSSTPNGRSLAEEASGDGTSAAEQGALEWRASSTGVQTKPQEDRRSHSLPQSSETTRLEMPTALQGSWRSGSLHAHDHEENTPNSYNPPGRGSRSMKVLKPSKSPHQSRTSSAARTGASYEPAPTASPAQYRRKSQEAGHASFRPSGKGVVTDVKHAEDGAPKAKLLARSPNPIGGASAFAWMKQSSTAPKVAAAD